MTPALLINVSNRPNCSTVRATMARTEASSVTSVSMTRASESAPIRAANSSSRRSAAGGHSHPGPLGGQSQGRGLPDATRRPGDQGHGSFQTTCHGPLPIGVLVAVRFVPGGRGCTVVSCTARCTSNRRVSEHPAVISRRPGRSPSVPTWAGCDPGAGLCLVRVRPGRRAMRPFASTWPASRTGCAGDLVDESTCRRASVSMPGSRAAHTNLCCCNERAAPDTAVRCRSDPFRTPQAGYSPPGHRPGTSRPRLDAFPPSWTYPFVSFYGNK